MTNREIAPFLNAIYCPHADDCDCDGCLERKRREEAAKNAEPETGNVIGGNTTPDSGQ